MTAYKQVENELLFYKQHDILTRLYNRSFFDQARQHYDQPDHLPLSVMICDINGLKNINETRGHVAGDRILLQWLMSCKDTSGRRIFLPELEAMNFVC